MKIKTLGLLAATGMFLTSLSVWSLTTPRPEVVAVAVDPPAKSARQVEPAAPSQQAASQFVSGNTLLVEGRLGFKARRANQQTDNFVYVDITAAKDQVGKSVPLNLAIVLDRSGSMRGKRLDNALAAARGMIQRLRDGDVLSLVTYNTHAEVKVASIEINSQSRSRVLHELDNIQAQGDTCISCGLETASRLLMQRTSMVDQMLLLSDGEATTGVKDEAGFRRIAAGIQRQGVSISTIGVDVDYNERVMAAIAEETNGRHHFVENVAKLSSIFDEELKNLTQTLADEAELSVSLAPGVSVLEVFDRSYRQVGDRLVVPMGAFSPSDEKTLLVKVSVPAGQVGMRPIADVHLSYRDLTTDRQGTCEGSLSQVLVRDAQELTPLDPLVASRVERSETARALLGANALIKEGKAEAARELLATAKAKKRQVARRFAESPFASATKGADDVRLDFDRQEQALAAAEAGVAEGPRGKPVEPESRRAKAAVRNNQSVARDAAF